MLMNKLIVGMGEALFDCLPDGKKIGGAPANFAYHASQFGFESCVVSAVGKDADGDEILDIFAEKGLKSSIARVDYPTGTVQVQLDAQGVPCYDIKQQVAWDNIPYTPELEELSSQTVAVCFGSLAQRSQVSHSTILKFLDGMPNGDNCLKIFDINLRQQFYNKEVLDASMKRCNVLKINDEELVIVAEMFSLSGSTQEAQCRELMQRYSLKYLILTCGTQGSYAFSEDEMSHLDTPKVVVADTVGAGDSFTGAFTAAILKGKSISEAHRLAVDVSAFVCTQSGAMPVLPAELRNRLA